MAKKFKIIIFFISLSLSLCIMSNTYSRYIANTTGNVKLLFAKWQIRVNSTDITNSLNSSINISPVITENENVAKDKIAPSSKGYFDITIDTTNVDVSYNYSIVLNLNNIDIPDLVITKYYEIDEEGNESNKKILTGNKITGDEKDFEYSKNKTFRFEFEWLENTSEETMNDIKDTEIGNKAATENDQIQFNATISFEQRIKATTATL